ENYTTITLKCWDYFVDLMRNVTASELCEWKVISRYGAGGRALGGHRAGQCPGSPSVPVALPRPYSELQYCLEYSADRLNYSYPNALAEQFIFQSHHRYFHNCTLEHPVYFDPPEDVLLAMIIAPICLIPFLVTLVIWRSKDSKAQA
ncbi:RAMP2 protein, partial [Smithornis capensis]|nr:RAMP2 protein [Smithornis capensis]